MSSSGQRPIVIGSFAETTDTLANLCSLCPLIFASNGYIDRVCDREQGYRSAAPRNYANWNTDRAENRFVFQHGYFGFWSWINNKVVENVYSYLFNRGSLVNKWIKQKFKEIISFEFLSIKFIYVSLILFKEKKKNSLRIKQFLPA